MPLAASDGRSIELIFTDAATNQLLALPKADRMRLFRALQDVAATHPQRLAYVTEMIGATGFWRARKGNYRAVYEITFDAIRVVAVGHRKDIYD